MLAIEQYLVIYLISIYLIKCKDVKILCTFLSFNFILEAALYSYIGWSVYEYLILSVIIEVFLLLISFQFLKDIIMRNIFILCYVPTLLCPLFLLTIDHWITRNDFISYSFYLFCRDVGKYSNELFLTYLLYKKVDKSLKGIFWQIFVLGNYFYAIAR